jgi:Ras-related protein Rab-8A
MTKIPEEELEKYIKEYNLSHFKKVNLIGPSNVGKKTLLSYIEHYIDKSKDFEFSDNIKNVDTDAKNNPFLVEIIKKLSITYYDTKKLDINLYISNLDDIDIIKDNLDTLLWGSECIIVMIDISSAETFSTISEIIPLINTHMKKSLEYGDIPFFFISNKVDLEDEREVSGFEIKELIDNYPNIKSFEISLKLEKNANDDNINEFIIKLCNTISESEKKYSFCYDSLNLVKIREPMALPNDSEILQHSDNMLNFLILGSQTVGKTSFAQRLFKNEFIENTLMTLGIDVVRTIAELYGNLVKIELWDTAGQERLRSIPKKYYSKGDGFFLLFDVSDRKSFEDISGWVKDIRQTRGSGEGQNYEEKPNDEVLVLIGNKIDKINKRVISKEEATELAEKYNLKYYEISCKQGTNVYETFCDVIFEASSQNRRESTNFVLQRRKTKIQNYNHPQGKKCC